MTGKSIIRLQKDATTKGTVQELYLDKMQRVREASNFTESVGDAYVEVARDDPELAEAAVAEVKRGSVGYVVNG